MNRTWNRTCLVKFNGVTLFDFDFDSQSNDQNEIFDDAVDAFKDYHLDELEFKVVSNENGGE